MDQLYPIIRRTRRPLLVQDTPPVVATNVEPVKVEAIKPPEPINGDPDIDANDAQASDQSEPQ